MAAGDPGIRTAPAVTATATGRLLTLHLIDASGDHWAESFYIAVAATTAQIEDFAAEYAEKTQASLWKVTAELQWEGAEAQSNANDDQRDSVMDGVNLLFSSITLHNSQTPRLVAPILGVMDGDKDIPLTLEFLGITAAFIVLSPGYTFKTMQYTERRERKNNPRVG